MADEKKFVRMDEIPTDKELEMLELSRSIPDIKVLEKQVQKSIIGQDEQIQRIITAIYCALYFKSLKSNILIIGNSGTGKTATIEQIANNLGIPFSIEDATKYTQEGYVGSSVNDMIENLIEKADYDIERAKNGILVIDEIDKKSGENKDNVAEGKVLKSLLKVIEGAVIRIPDPGDAKETIEFDTKNLIVIFTGAFEGLDTIRDKRLNVNQLGFSTLASDEGNNSKKEFTKKDLSEYGMPKEFVGRISTIIEMNKLYKDDLIQILKKSNLSILKKYRSELNNIRIKLTFSPKLYEKIAERSLELDAGARELNSTVSHMFERVMYEILAHPGAYTRCKLSLDILDDNSKFELS